MTRESLHRVLRRYGVRCEDYRAEGHGDQAGVGEGLASKDAARSLQRRGVV